MSWFKGFEAIIRADVPLRDFTWYRFGGPARWFCEPRDEDQLVALLTRLRRDEIPWRILGGGANVIVRDAGFDGAVLHLAGPEFARIEFHGELVYAGAAADFPRLISAVPILIQILTCGPRRPDLCG